jgi:hypothetical protein
MKKGYRLLEIRSPREFERYEYDWYNYWKTIWCCQIYAAATRSVKWEIVENDKGRNNWIFQEAKSRNNHQALCITTPTPKQGRTDSYRFTWKPAKPAAISSVFRKHWKSRG